MPTAHAPPPQSRRSGKSASCSPSARRNPRPSRTSLRTGGRQRKSDRKQSFGTFYNALMIADRIEGKWIDLFAEVFARCKVAAGEACAVLSESQSRALNVQLAELALQKLGARPFHVVVPTPRQSAPVPIRSTGASTALQGLGPAIGALAAASFVADCTVEGLMHAAELPQILKGGAPGDLNLTFKRYLESAVRLRIESDYVTAIEGTGLDAELMREYFAAWDDREAYAVSHVGWGTNPRARWEALALYDRRDVNGTE